jgi:hypothetical protein
MPAIGGTKLKSGVWRAASFFEKAISPEAPGTNKVVADVTLKLVDIESHWYIVSQCH